MLDHTDRDEEVEAALIQAVRRFYGTQFSSESFDNFANLLGIGIRSGLFSHTCDPYNPKARKVVKLILGPHGDAIIKAMKLRHENQSTEINDVKTE